MSVKVECPISERRNGDRCFGKSRTASRITLDPSPREDPAEPGRCFVVDSSGIGELVAGFTSVTNAGGTLKLLGLTERVKDLLQITKLYTFFDLHEDGAHAVRSFV